MASAKTHPPGTCNGSKAEHPTPAEEYNQEIHVKMCKKIAQLTKVIYSLNTKNDELEASIHTLKDAHKEEIDNIVSETKERINQCKINVGEELELRQRLQALDEAVELHKKLREEAVADLALYQKQVEERDHRTQIEHAERIISLSKEMLDIKADLEKQLHLMNQEAGSLRKECTVYRKEYSEGKEKLSEQHSLELQALLEEMKSLKTENQKISEECVQKTMKLQATHEKEREALKKALQQSVTETLKQWQQRDLEQKKSFQAQEAALQQQVKKLEVDIEVKSQKMSELKKHSHKMKDRIQDLETQLREMRQETAESKHTLQKMAEELTVSKERLMLQEREIHSKTEQVKTVLNSQNDAVSELDDLKNQISQLQKASNQSNPTNKSADDSLMLKQCLEERAVEREEMKQRHEEELCRIRRQSDEEKMRLKEQLVKGLEELVKKHTLEIKSVQASMEAERRKLQKDLQLQLEEFKTLSDNEMKQQEKEKEILKGKLKDSSFEVARLEQLMKQKQTSGGPKEALQPHSKKSRDRMQLELDRSRCRILELQEQLQKEREQIKEHLPSTGAKKEERTRIECRCALKKDDQQCLPSEKKEAEIKVLQEDWKKQRHDLQSQIAQLKQALEQQNNKSKEALKELTVQSSKEKDKLCQDLQDSIKQSQTMKAHMEAVHQRALKTMERSKKQEAKETEERVKKERTESLRLLNQSHRLEMQALEEKARRELQAERDRVLKQQSALLDSLRMELSEQHVSSSNQRKQIDELLNELKTLRGLKKHQEESNQSQIASLHGELNICQSEILELKNENLLLKDSADLLTAELEIQKQEASQFQDKEERHRRLLEEELKMRQKLEVESLRQEHRKEMQTMVSDFSSSQAHLQAKVVSLENEIKEIEEKPRKRESRPEDLQLIGRLQEKLTERDQVIKRLSEERKVQHTVPVSETHRNRSYSFNPSNGSLTPTLKKKKMDEAPIRVVSVPNLVSYEKSFTNSEVMQKRNIRQIVKSPSLDQSPSRGRPCEQKLRFIDSKPLTRPSCTVVAKPKEEQAQETKRPEWFTKYFSF
ncbi:protein FAM184B isoform X1 [Ambystoma mexicanum]|uniref:protein FAM184B isoform X1 n=1 Tax=Ambystoma mexicanum TaxID=8296 RepID=UPI0037E97F07